MVEIDVERRMQLAAEVAGSCRAYLAAMYGPGGLPVDVVLSGALAQVVALMVAGFGGALTAKELRRAADEVEGKPSLSALALALAEPEGRA